MVIYAARDLTSRGQARDLLALAVRETWRLSPLPEIARREGGKPYFPGHEGLHFNLSHSGDLALCALDSAPVGVDVQIVREWRPGLPARVCSGAELDWLEGQPDLWSAFTLLWTLKEARVKCTGQGLRRPPREISVPLLEPGETGDWDGFRFTALAGEVWRGALCEKLT